MAGPAVALLDAMKTIVVSTFVTFCLLAGLTNSAGALELKSGVANKASASSTQHGKTVSTKQNAKRGGGRVVVHRRH